jgi:nitroimidazol reductase NimA-like FMN-containing flavoprotein (pyridoxamine 5'-phosphate oxidase superfamily)
MDGIFLLSLFFMRKKEREIKDIEELEDVISRSDVCRIAFADNNFPYIVTLNFGYIPGINRRLYFHCASEGRKIDLIKKNNLVCFEMDTDHMILQGPRPCDFSMRYSSIVGWGRITIIDYGNEKKEGLDSIMRHFSQEKTFTYSEEILRQTTVLRLDILEMTGKRIH